MFNPRAVARTVPIGDGRHCVVIDDALVGPERLPAFAHAYREDFEQAHANQFPGVQLRLPDEFTGLLDDVFREHARRPLGARRTLFGASRLSLYTSSPQALAPPHWSPRRIRAFEPGHCIVLAELFLFRDEALGGLRFFVPRVSPQQIERMEHDAEALAPDEFSHRHGVSAGYPHGASANFADALNVPARWNRLVFHDGASFHAPDIAEPARLAADPRTGRLSLTAAFTCSRPRVAW
ncbi:hypothetical protein SAMN05428982_3537 [Pseudoxanthomonas sp. CF385]|uniref:DUF6445 family protein n=1 Tax=Pseudoxanthomonas sp. CF385 TaxID=1881042 RepID=UPI0008896836|nr:DUF6445 family protein [Pseudoxanthomonas sp. CF385]SDR19485.1 hypothetical protein SAMN05428982_3537 [Pseudoxanthomonas sp. CF385]